jgi:beta-lactamase regulating signal transducer with metallopeptidase domain
MEQLLTLVGVKALLALLLALVVGGIGIWLRRPALLHLLWIVVLLELFVPPLLEVGVLPRPAAPAVASPQPALEMSGALPLSSLEAVASPVASSWIPSWPAIALGVWGCGAAAVLLLTVTRLRRFRRLLHGMTDAPAALRATADRLAAKLGLRRTPPIRLVEATISPMLCPRLGRFELLFPAGLLRELEPREREALLAHELAHLKRRDHWVRWLELAATSLFWWHPAVWWASSRLRQAEEQCCDALVLDTFPDRARPYASGLVKTVEFLSGARNALPSLASGAGGARKLEERLTMIVKRRLPKRLTRLQHVALAASAALLLLVVPTWADRSSDRDAERDAEMTIEVRESLLALEEEAIALETELRELRERQRALEMELRERHEQIELEQLEELARAVEAEGDTAAIERVRREQARRKQEIELEAQRDRIEAERRRELARFEDPLRRMHLEAEAAELRGEREQAEALRMRVRELQIEAEREMHAAAREQAELEQKMHTMMLDRMRAEAEAPAVEDQAAAAVLRRLERELELLELELDVAREHDQARETAILEEQLVKLKAVLDERRTAAERAR